VTAPSAGDRPATANFLNPETIHQLIEIEAVAVISVHLRTDLAADTL
jgi:hypothetical protein